MRERMGEGMRLSLSSSSCDAHAKPRWPAQSPPVYSGLTVKRRPGSVTMSFSKALSPDALRQQANKPPARVRRSST